MKSKQEKYKSAVERNVNNALKLKREGKRTKYENSTEFEARLRLGVRENDRSLDSKIKELCTKQ